MPSKVYLVGAGPGDAELITVKGRRVLERAEVVLYDYLANPALLELAPANALRVYVGKKKAAHAYSQEEISAMLVGYARQGLRVVRLKGGDPYIFGRGGEEAESLADAGLEFEVVPGVTSPLGIAAYTGVPLTHRDHTSVVSFVTGHEVEQIDWSKVGQAETLVILMGLTTIGQIARELIANGRSPETPAMIVRWATRPNQETLVGTLETLPRLVDEHHLRPPATIVIGEVVRLREKLNWFERLPLFGQSVAVTRPLAQSAGLSQMLCELGAGVVALPTIEIGPAADYAALDRAIGELERYDWLIFTSANGVAAFLDRLDRSGRDLRALHGRLAAIGPATQSALERLHLKVDLSGEEFVAESLITAFEPFDLRGARVLLARAAVARDLLPRTLEQRGAEVHVVEAYRTGAPEGLAERAHEVLRTGRRPDWITFTSSSTVENLLRVIEPGELAGIRAATIGPVTSATLRRYGIEPAAEASVYTSEGLTAAIREAGIIET